MFIPLRAERIPFTFVKCIVYDITRKNELQENTALQNDASESYILNAAAGNYSISIVTKPGLTCFIANIDSEIMVK